MPGRLLTTASGNPAFLPSPLPPKLDLGEPELLDSLLLAAENVSALGQAANDIRNSALIAAISNLRANIEAQMSSRIEGIETTITDLLWAYRQERRGSVTNLIVSRNLEVLNYLHALRIGQARLLGSDALPICSRLIRELHARLMQDVRGATLDPGEFRRVQNSIGRSGASEADSIYTPPPPQEVAPAMSELEKFINRDDINIFVKTALVHYQFEAIHPFSDGNGRVGRLLVTLMLLEGSRLSQPLIYPSAYLEEHRQQYYELLLRVSTQGDWHAWLVFFLKGIASQASSALERVGLLRELHGHYREQLVRRNAPIRLERLLDHIFSNPLIGQPEIMEHLGVSRTTAFRYMEHLLSTGMLEPLHPQQSNHRWYVARELLNILE
ncbi:MAG: Fic family protein [bacterium]